MSDIAAPRRHRPRRRRRCVGGQHLGVPGPAAARSTLGPTLVMHSHHQVPRRTLRRPERRRRGQGGRRGLQAHPSHPEPGRRSRPRLRLLAGAARHPRRFHRARPAVGNARARGGFLDTATRA
ncbi:MAG: hypothetical protein MZV49_15495 [Rhodopseudomonas palustris]|nr:hypothetical protein [Rhodopseudomonas palustris]